MGVGFFNRNSYLREVAHEVPTKGQSETTSLLVLSITKVRLRTFDPPKPHSKWDYGKHLMVLQ